MLTAVGAQSALPEVETPPVKAYAVVAPDTQEPFHSDYTGVDGLSTGGVHLPPLTCAVREY